MTDRSEERDWNLSARLRLPLLAMLLGFAVRLGFTVNAWRIMKPPVESRVWLTLSTYAINLLVIGAIWAVARRKPSKPKIVGLSLLLGLIALAGFSGAAALWKFLAASDTPWGAWTWQTKVIFAANLLIGASAVWGFLRLKPLQLLKQLDEPVSPATRRTRLLFGLSGVISVLAVVALSLGTHDNEGRSAVWSNSRNVSPAIAFIAIAIWLLSIAIAWWWYRSADEHERRANDVGFLFGGGLFMAAAPVWWMLTRAGLAPPPDAMILWYATIVAMGIGWWWYRSR